MIRFRQAFREALWIVLTASVLSFAYSFTTGKGMFEPLASVTPETGTPSMIHMEEARRLYDLNQALFIDSRHAFEFQLGHIRGAVNIPLAEFDLRKDLVGALPKDKALVTYCDGANCNSSIELAVRLQAAGFSGVKVFFGGWQEWRSQFLPTEGAKK